MPLIEAATQRLEKQLPILLVQEVLLSSGPDSHGCGEAGVHRVELPREDCELSIWFAPGVMERELGESAWWKGVTFLRT